MANLLNAHHTYKAPKWTKNKKTKHKPFPKRKAGNVTFAEQLAIVVIFTILLMIIMS